MRKVVFGGANSLDNYFARKNHSVDWIMWSDEAAKLMADYWRTFDTMVMGRRTYEDGVKLTKGKKNPFGMQTYVFSRTLKPVRVKDLKIVSEDVAVFVKE